MAKKLKGEEIRGFFKKDVFQIISSTIVVYYVYPNDRDMQENTKHNNELTEQKLTKEVWERNPAHLDIHSPSTQALLNQIAQESELKMRAIIDSALDAVIVINQEAIIIEWNTQAEITFGWTAEEAVGQPLTEMIIPPQYRAAHNQGMKHFLATGEGPALKQRIEIFALNRLGREFPIELTILPILVGDTYFFSSFIRDITKRKREEEKKEKLLTQLEQANAELREFAYLVSHDLKAPLRAISSLATWIAEDNEDKFDEEGKRQFALLRGRVNRMKELITGILEYSKIGKVNTELHSVPVKELIEDISSMLIEGDSTELRLVGEFPTIMYNRTCAQQIFQNLISNALKYNDKEHCIIEVGVKRCTHHHTFWVKDNGPGIEEKYQEKVFKIFQTLRPRDEVEATGVGLSIVKKTINLFGGDIWIESKPGEGTSMLFTVPHQPEINYQL